MDTHTPRARFKPETLAKLRRFIRDPKAADTFINEAWAAVETYRSMRPFKNVGASRRELERLRKAAKSYADMMLRAASLRAAWPTVTGGAFPRERIANSQRDACLIARWAEGALAETKPGRRGRPLDGAGIILLQRLAVAFKTAGERVSAADRSKFVRVVEALSRDQHFGLSDVRQKVMDALPRR